MGLVLRYDEISIHSCYISLKSPKRAKSLWTSLQSQTTNRIYGLPHEASHFLSLITAVSKECLSTDVETCMSPTTDVLEIQDHNFLFKILLWHVGNLKNMTFITDLPAFLPVFSITFSSVSLLVRLCLLSAQKRCDLLLPLVIFSFWGLSLFAGSRKLTLTKAEPTC